MLDEPHSRRRFMALAAGGMAGALSGPWLRAAAAAELRDADLVVFNAKVYTVDKSAPTAEAFAVRNGRFIAVGRSNDVQSLIGKGTQTVDAKQMTVVPGFIDCHVHANGEVLLYETLVGNPFEVEHVTIASIVEKLRKKASQTPPGTWVEGYFFDDTKLKDRRDLTVHDLDRVSTEHPVAVFHRGGHSGFYNSKALQLAGVTRDTPSMAGGTFDRGDDGALTGRVTDQAMHVFRKVGKRRTFTPEEKQQRSREGLAHISKQFARYGLTSVHHQGGDLLGLQQVRERGELLHRVSFEVSGEPLEAMIASGIKTGFGDDWIRLGATSEHTADGSFSERTMALSTPYPGITPPYTGNITQTQEELNAWVERVHKAGIQPNIHANGDVAIDMALTAYERAQALFPRADSRPKITHCTLINDDLLRRIKATGTVPAVFTSYLYYNADKFSFYGEDMMKRALAFRSFIDAGVPVAAGSDFSPGPFSPLMGLQGMVTRTGWNGKTWGANQRISIEEALRVYTLHGAYASRDEAAKGSISTGKLADFVILAEDPHSIPADKIKDIQIVRTVTGGSTVFQA